jgi:hypothetical protein
MDSDGQKKFAHKKIRRGLILARSDPASGLHWRDSVDRSALRAAMQV